MQPHAVEISDVSMVFHARGRKLKALESINMNVGMNRFVSILGPSGCGKTTLLKIVGGLLRPSQGKVRVLGDDVSAALKNRAFGFVFQEPTLLYWRDVLGNTTILLEIIHRGRRRGELDEKPREFLNLVGLSQFEKAYPHELSGGMKQRVAIARALSIDPGVLLMDEPFGALDAITRDRMNVELQDIWMRNKKTVIFITHSIIEAVFLSDTVYVMSQRPGKIIEVLDIELERPRPLEIQESQDFSNYKRHLRDVLYKGIADGEAL